MSCKTLQGAGHVLGGVASEWSRIPHDTSKRTIKLGIHENSIVSSGFEPLRCAVLVESACMAPLHLLPQIPVRVLQTLKLA